MIALNTTHLVINTTPQAATSTVEFSPDGILAYLRSRGLRVTRSRRGIILALFRATRPLSLTELQQQAQVEGGILPDYATVFRMMVLLESLNIVHKVNLRRSCSYFELTYPGRQYYHLVCTRTGTVTRLEIPCPVAEVERFIKDKFGYTNLTHSLEFFGVSPEGAELPPAPAPTPEPVAAQPEPPAITLPAPVTAGAPVFTLPANEPAA